MTTFVKSTDLGISVPILATDNIWYGKNNFLGTAIISDATFGGFVSGQINCSGLGTFNLLTVTNGATIGSLTVTNGATIGSLTVTNGATIGSLSCTGTALVSGELECAVDLIVNGALLTSGLVYENILPITSGSGVSYSLNFFTGGLFYIPSGSNITGNATLIVTNIPLENLCYTFTVISYQTTRFFINQLKILNKNNNYVFGSSGAFATPLFNGGVPVLSGTTACIVIQQFTVISFGNTRYVTSSVSACT